MNVYVLPKGKAEEFSKLCRSVKLKDGVTDKQFKEAGFTNYYEPTFYYCKGLACEDNYPVSFDIEVDKKARKIKAMGVLDDNFLQPHFVDEPLFNQVKNHIDKLINYGILEVV